MKIIMLGWLLCKCIYFVKEAHSKSPFKSSLSEQRPVDFQMIDSKLSTFESRIGFMTEMHWRNTTGVTLKSILSKTFVIKGLYNKRESVKWDKINDRKIGFYWSIGNRKDGVCLQLDSQVSRQPKCCRSAIFFSSGYLACRK